ncbi:MAG: hypothetical protein WEB56_08835, partial [Roseovarius sp.]
PVQSIPTRSECEVFQMFLKTVIPCHYRTFDALEQSAEMLIAALPGTRVIEPKVMEALDL